MLIETNSSLQCHRKCPYQYYLAYVLLVRRKSEATPLRFGSAWHLYHETQSIEQALQGYDGIDDYDMQIERETLAALMAGHRWLYPDEQATREQTFTIRVQGIRNILMEGKIDGKTDTHLIEYKTTSEDISSDSGYWMRLRGDPQVSLYCMATGVNTVLYDVVRKPTIAPRQVPILDDAGMKIVNGPDGRVFLSNGKPRQTADSALGYVLQARPETPEEFGKRLLEDITARPDYYFARREITRDSVEMRRFHDDLKNQLRTVRDARRHDRWYRNVSFSTCPYCPYADLCLQSIPIDPANPPAGYITVDDPHQELIKKGTNHDSGNTSETAEPVGINS